MLDRFLHQKRFPRFTALSILTTVGAWAVYFHSPGHAGFESAGYRILAILVVAAGLVLNCVWGDMARVRGEYGGVWIANAGIALPVAVLIGWAVVSAVFDLRRWDAAEHARMWGPIDRVFVQPDGKLVLLGAGLVRLLPDGQPDPSFRRDYSFARGGSLPERFRERSPFGYCAAMAPNGDLILANNGWIGRIRPDGSDGPDLQISETSLAGCWGLAVQSDGKILIGWREMRANRLIRLFPGGSVDTGFHSAIAPLSYVGDIAIQGDGRIALVGEMGFVGSECFGRLLRLNADGSLDRTFGFAEPCLPTELVSLRFADLDAALPNGSMLVRIGSFEHGSADEMMFLDRDGKRIEIPKLLDALQPLPRSPIGFTRAVPLSDGRILLVLDGLVRVLKDGTLDSTFHARVQSSSISQVLVQGGKIIVVDTSGMLVRLNGDGSPDPSFQMPTLKVYSD
ncbi:MAG TPA: hypothetical protein VKF41_06595 [Bryobacteraceae bacterium]|nr:hypothetical protein [Bryobacteraceae bacterium]